jgi:hypothetical protein
MGECGEPVERRVKTSAGAADQNEKSCRSGKTQGARQRRFFPMATSASVGNALVARITSFRACGATCRWPIVDS